MMAYSGPNIIILRHLFKKAFESRAILTGRRLVGREEGGEGDRADDEQRGEGGEQLQARFKPVVLQDVLVDEAQADGEDGAAGGDYAVDDAHPLEGHQPAVGVGVDDLARHLVDLPPPSLTWGLGGL